MGVGVVAEKAQAVKRKRGPDNGPPTEAGKFDNKRLQVRSAHVTRLPIPAPRACATVEPCDDLELVTGTAKLIESYVEPCIDDGGSLPHNGRMRPTKTTSPACAKRAMHSLVTMP